MEGLYLKSISIVENNFDNIAPNLIEKWKHARFANYDKYYQEMFFTMKQNMTAIDSHKVQCWLEVSAYYFDYKSKFFYNWHENIEPMEIEK